MEYPLAHSHLLLKRLLALNKPKSLAPAFHYVYMLGEVSQVCTGTTTVWLKRLLTYTRLPASLHLPNDPPVGVSYTA